MRLSDLGTAVPSYVAQRKDVILYPNARYYGIASYGLTTYRHAASGSVVGYAYEVPTFPLESVKEHATANGCDLLEACYGGA